MIKSTRNGNSRNLFGRHNVLFLISLFFNIFLAYKLWTTSAMKDITQMQYEEVKHEALETHQKQLDVSAELNNIKHESHETQMKLDSCVKESDACKQNLVSEKTNMEECDLRAQNCVQDKEECNAQLTSRNSMLQTATTERDTCTTEMTKKNEELQTCQTEKSNFGAELERLKGEVEKLQNAKKVEQNNPDSKEVHKQGEGDQESPAIQNQSEEPGAAKTHAVEEEAKPEDNTAGVDGDLLMSCNFTTQDGPGETCKMTNGNNDALKWLIVPDTYMMLNTSTETSSNNAEMEFGPLQTTKCAAAVVRYLTGGSGANLELRSNGNIIGSFEPEKDWTVTAIYLGDQSKQETYKLTGEISDPDSIIAVASVEFRETKCVSINANPDQAFDDTEDKTEEEDEAIKEKQENLVKTFEDEQVV